MTSPIAFRFIDASAPPGDALEAEAGKSQRQRRPHGKSRSGCRTCKERRVKCDERHPCCLNCMRLNLQCGFVTGIQANEDLKTKAPPVMIPYGPTSNVRKGGPRSLPPRQLTLAPALSDPNIKINMAHMRLFYHYEQVTSGTLFLGPEVWKGFVIPYALQDELLLHGILLMAVSHLRFLQPREVSHWNQELEHSSHVIRGFSDRLSQPITTKSAYILGICSMLILQYSWTSFDPTVEENDLSNSGFGTLSALYAGLRQLSPHFLALDDPYLTPIMYYRPILRISQHFENSTLLSEVVALFTHCCQCPSWSNSQVGTFYDRMSAARGLIPLLSALRLDPLSLETSGLIPDIVRCLFTMPMLTPDGFKHLLEENDEASLVIILYYWAAVRRLASGKFWWMRERAVYMSGKLLARLGGRCEECTGWAAKICDGDWS